MKIRINEEVKSPYGEFIDKSLFTFVEDVQINIDYEVNDSVRITNGPLVDFIGVVQEINTEKHKVKVLVSMFGRETPVDLEFSQVQKVV